MEIARHGFEIGHAEARRGLDTYRDVLGRHGIEISATRVRKVVKHVTREKEKTRAWRRILEQTTSTLLRQSASGPSTPADDVTSKKASS